jgi:hypothetical protein
MTENMQMASTMNLPHSSRMECVDSVSGRFIELRCLSRLRSFFTLRGTALAGRDQWRFRA